MPTKSTTTTLTEKEVKYQQKVKSVELAIKSQGSKQGITSDALIKVAGKIYDYLIV